MRVYPLDIRCVGPILVMSPGGRGAGPAVGALGGSRMDVPAVISVLVAVLFVAVLWIGVSDVSDNPGGSLS